RDPMTTRSNRVNQRAEEGRSTRSIASELPAFARRHAGLLLAASVVAVGALAACSSDSNTSPSGPADAGGTLDAGSTATDSGSPGADSGPDAGVDPVSAQSVRDFIGAQVGGVAKLTVPADDQSMPVPPDDPSRPGRYKTTAAKKYLGKLLFHDPV